MTLLLVLVGAAAAVLVLGAVLLYLRRRLVRDPFAPGRGRTVAGAVAAGLLGSAIGCLLLGNLGPDAVAGLLVPGWLGLSAVLYLLLSLLVLELPRRALRRWSAGSSAAPHGHDHAPGGGHHHGPDGGHEHDLPHGGGDGGGAQGGASAGDPVDPGRRLVLNRALAGTAGAVAVATTGFGFVRARTVKAKPVTVPLARLDPAADGLRIALLSDIHLTRGLRERSWTAQTVATVNRADVDLVAIVGDLVDGSVAELGEFATPLRDLRAPLGTFFVTGNHEYFSGADEWAAFLPELGVRVLRNERVEIVHRGVTIDLAGVDDVAGERYAGGPDLPRALADRDVDRTLILLAHQPVLVDESAAAGVDLQLSGHTHGGQLWPLHYLVRLQQGHLAGLERVGDTVLYTTRGVGTWGPPVRVGAPPEITVLTLRSA